MEQFKQCEKETKTKAYSKEGLLVAQQKDDAKDNSRQWIAKCLDGLQQQHDKVEAELEQLKAKKVTLCVSLTSPPCLAHLHLPVVALRSDFPIKNASLYSQGKKDQERIDSLEHALERHQFHTNSLEKCLRMLDNDTITPDNIDEIKDVVEHYIENNQEADFVEDEEIYTSIGNVLSLSLRLSCSLMCATGVSLGTSDGNDEGDEDGGDGSADDEADETAAVEEEPAAPTPAPAPTPAAGAHPLLSLCFKCAP